MYRFSCEYNFYFSGTNAKSRIWGAYGSCTFRSARKGLAVFQRGCTTVSVPSVIALLLAVGRPQTERQQKLKALGTGQFPEESTCQWGPGGPFFSVPGPSLALPSARSLALGQAPAMMCPAGSCPCLRQILAPFSWGSGSN